MTLPVDRESDGYRFYKTLHNDVLLTSSNGSVFDISFNGEDIVTVTGEDSLCNACIIAIMTRYQELEHIPLYDGFGCRVHENIKKNKTTLTRRKIETQTYNTLNAMRRVKKVNWIEVTSTSYGYSVEFSVTSINDKTILGEVSI